MISATIFVWVLCFCFAIHAHHKGDKDSDLLSFMIGEFATLGTICCLVRYLP